LDIERAAFSSTLHLSLAHSAQDEVSTPNACLCLTHQKNTRIGTHTDIKELYNRIEETIASITKLNDALLTQQAVIALKGVSPLNDALNPVQKPTASLRELEVFNVQVAITDFSSSFKELEAEYMRVKSEEAVGKHVNQLLERIERNQ
jgi:hypothetical protein